MDYELWIRMLPGSRIRYLNRPLGVARVHPATKSANPALQNHWENDARRNGLAHPELYRKQTWLHREFSIVQRLVRRLRSRGQTANLRNLQKECAWAAPIDLAK